MKKGLLIVLDGVDASGKQTQCALLHERLFAEGFPVRKISFPNYESPACQPVKMYLAGEFGPKPSDVNPYAASVFYAVDRFASYKKNWQEHLENGGIVLCDRYTTSNAIHQAAKLEGSARDEYLDWIECFEYKLMGLPSPDIVFFLDMPSEFSNELLAQRMAQSGLTDIHESDCAYMRKSYDAAIYAAKRLGWSFISCISENKIRTVTDIGEEIYHKVRTYIEGN